MTTSLLVPFCLYGLAVVVSMALEDQGITVVVMVLVTPCPVEH